MSYCWIMSFRAKDATRQARRSRPNPPQKCAAKNLQHIYVTERAGAAGTAAVIVRIDATRTNIERTQSSLYDFLPEIVSFPLRTRVALVEHRAYILVAI